MKSIIVFTNMPKIFRIIPFVACAISVISAIVSWTAHEQVTHNLLKLNQPNSNSSLIQLVVKYAKEIGDQSMFCLNKPDSDQCFSIHKEEPIVLNGNETNPIVKMMNLSSIYEDCGIESYNIERLGNLMIGRYLTGVTAFDNPFLQHVDAEFSTWNEYQGLIAELESAERKCNI